MLGENYSRFISLFLQKMVCKINQNDQFLIFLTIVSYWVENDGFFQSNLNQTISDTYQSDQRNSITGGVLLFPNSCSEKTPLQLNLNTISTNSREESFNIDFEKVHLIYFLMVYDMTIFIKNQGHRIFSHKYRTCLILNLEHCPMDCFQLQKILIGLVKKVQILLKWLLHCNINHQNSKFLSYHW